MTTPRPKAVPKDGSSVVDGDGFVRLTIPTVESVEHVVTGALRDAILRGDLRPGQRLRQEHLADRMGVSRIPLRDALRRLQAEGLVWIDARRGAQVAELTPDDVREIYEMRTLLEEYCMRLAMRKLDDAGAARLIAMSEKMDRLVHKPHEGGAARRAFYSELYGYAGRERMRHEILRLRDDVHRYHVIKNTDASRHDHDEIRACIRARDADRAARAIKEHLRRASSDLVEILTRERQG